MTGRQARIATHAYSCGFCGLQGKRWRGPDRPTAIDADEDWKVHVRTEHADLQWTHDHAAQLAPRAEQAA